MFISFEGIDGCGKTTQIRLLADRLESLGYSVLIIREPGGTGFSEEIRKILLSHRYNINPIAELLLFEAARTELVSTVIVPALNNNTIVLTDRFYDSTTAYQGYGRQIDINQINNCNQIATNGLKPDMTLFLDVSLETSKIRSGHRRQDRIEQSGAEFYSRVRNGFLEIAKQEPDRFFVISAEHQVDETHLKILELLGIRYPKLLEGKNFNG